MYKVGDKVRLILIDRTDTRKGMKYGDIFKLTAVSKATDEVCVSFNGSSDDCLYTDQIEPVEIIDSTHFNFITKRQIAEHLQKVITFYEDYTSDLLKETTRDYKENIIDLKETGYEYRLELDKILVEVEE